MNYWWMITIMRRLVVHLLMLLQVMIQGMHMSKASAELSVSRKCKLINRSYYHILYHRVGGWVGGHGVYCIVELYMYIETLGEIPTVQMKEH